jgi:hypothetical protein
MGQARRNPIFPSLLESDRSEAFRAETGCTLFEASRSLMLQMFKKGKLTFAARCRKANKEHTFCLLSLL